MENTQKTLINFPCDFVIKIFGLATQEFRDSVNSIIAAHGQDLSPEFMQSRSSKDGKYEALSVTVYVESQDQLDSIYRDLTKDPLVLMSL